LHCVVPPPHAPTPHAWFGRLCVAPSGITSRKSSSTWPSQSLSKPSHDSSLAPWTRLDQALYWAAPHVAQPLGPPHRPFGFVAPPQTPCWFSHSGRTMLPSAVSSSPSQSLSLPSQISGATFSMVVQTMPPPLPLHVVTPPAQAPTPHAVPTPLTCEPFGITT